MKIVIVPSGFKECLDAEDVALAMERGAQRYNGAAEIEIIPMIDGGEGFSKTITRLKGGQLISIEATGPVGKKVNAHFGIFAENGEKTAVIEMAAVAGLKHVPFQERNPLLTTTYGVGELILAALDFGADRILIGCGDSGTSDGGAGMAQALGVRFLDADGNAAKIKGGADLLKVKQIDDSGLDKRVRQIEIDVACNWKNVLCGGNGVARVFGPQKGASREQVEILSEAMEHYANVIEESYMIDFRYLKGGGASGGLGAGLAAFAGAVLHPRFSLIRKYISIEEKIASADIVLTAEGSIDFQTPNGKIPTEVARIAKKYDIPVIAITGTIGKGASLNYEAGIDAFLSIIPKPTSLEKAIQFAPQWIEDSTELVMRQVDIGYKIACRSRVNEGAV
ncbi:glycerate kinase [Sporosarcina globispora]|uniref:Glycerate kinase n=1 Tax=Sporosarcina globispora TaxID=1459 RepID=A0A0M0GG66_SPOGL|nr:glycerate kinase [Sporosarcina globispora]KON88773.1 glycerate kinase [Sporosarcina globispora]